MYSETPDHENPDNRFKLLSVKILLRKSKEVLGQDVEFRKLRRNIMLLSLLMSGYSLISTVNMRAREKKGNARIRRCHLVLSAIFLLLLKKLKRFN